MRMNSILGKATLMMGMTGIFAITIAMTIEMPVAVPAVLAQDLAGLREPPKAETIRVVSPSADQIALTIYRDNLAFITETRTIDVPAGRSTLAFEGVSDLMIPQTAILREFGAVSLERNFDFSLLSQGSLLDKSVGKTVYLSRRNPATGELIEEEATIISAGRGVVMDIDGRIETFDCSGLPESISFSEIPEGLLAQPTLSIEVSAEKAGPQEFTISYLASGFDWEADYILRLGDDQKTAALDGWLTMTNGTAISIKNAPTAIVAGDLQRLWETRADTRYADSFFASCWPKGSTKRGTFHQKPGSQANMRVKRNQTAFAAAAPMEDGFLAENDAIIVSGARIKASREDLGDYKLFRTPEPTSVNAYQTKQVLFLDKKNIEVDRVYTYDVDPYDYGTDDVTVEPTTLRYDIDNDFGGALGEPLPQGNMRVMVRGASDAAGDRAVRPWFYVGQDSIDDKAVGLPVEVEVAESPSVMIGSRLLSEAESDEKDGGTRYRYRLDHRITNANPWLVTVELTFGKNSYYTRPPSISRASRRQIKGEPVPTWRFDVAPNSSASLTYSVEVTN